MKKRIITKAFMLFASCIFAQTTSTYLNAKQAQEFADLAKSAELYVVIENEKAPFDAALVEAVKSYWKITKIKYISTLEFLDKYKSSKLDPKNFYLYTVADVLGTQMYSRYSLGLHSGYYLTNDPKKMLSARKSSGAPPYLYFSANSLGDSKGNINKGFFQLMIKNFNYELEYCKNPENFSGKKKYKISDGLIFIKEQKEFEGKNLLVVKEQVAKKEKNDKSKKSKGKKEETAMPMNMNKGESQIKMYVVFPEDIEQAIKKSDKDIILYTGGNLYSAADGSVYVTPKPYKPSSFGIITSVVSVVVTVVFLVIALKS